MDAATRRRTTIIHEPRPATPRTAAIDALEWLPVQASALQVASRVRDVRAFGTIGTTNDTAVFQAAIAAAAAAGGGVVSGPKGTYQFQGGISHTPGVSFDFPDGTVFDFSSASTFVSGACWYGAGAFVALPALAANITMHGRTITCASAPAVVPGDWVNVYNPTDYSFHTERTYYRAGEAVRVLSVAGNVITTTDPMYAAYTVASGTVLHKYTPARFGIRGVEFIFPASGALGIVFDMATDVELNIEAKRGARAQITLLRSVDITIDSPDLYSADPVDGSDTNYGISIGNCQQITINDPSIRVGRHGFTTGGMDAVGAIPNRNITVNNGTIGNTDSTTCGVDTHGNTEWVTFNNVTMPNGCHLAGDHTRATGRIQSAGTGEAVSINHMRGWDFVIDATIVATRQVTANGLVYIVANSECVTDGELRIGGRIDLGAYRVAAGTTDVIGINNASTQKPRIRVEASVSATGISPGDAVRAAYIRAGGSTFDRVTLDRTHFDGLGCVVTNCDTAILRDNTCLYAPLHGLQVTATVIKSSGNYVRYAALAGMNYAGPGKAVSGGEIHSDGDIGLDCNNGTSATNNVGLFVHDVRYAIVRGHSVGDTRGTTKQTRSWSIVNIGASWETPATILGSVATVNRSSVDGTTNV